MKFKVFYLLPCYNEEQDITGLLKKFDNFYRYKKININLIFVDDGSTDQSVNIINNFKKKIRKIKIHIIKHKTNKGLGVALKTGFNYILKKGKNNDVIVTMDTDNSHTIKLSMKMINEIRFKNKDIVIASRYCEKSKIFGLSIFRKFLSFGAAKLFQFFYPIKGVKDYTSGFRAFKLGTLKNIIKKYKNKFFSETGFSVTADILIKTQKYKNMIKYYELPINLRYDLKKGSSKMKIFKTIYLNLKILLFRKFN